MRRQLLVFQIQLGQKWVKLEKVKEKKKGSKKGKEKDERGDIRGRRTAQRKEDDLGRGCRSSMGK